MKNMQTTTIECDNCKHDLSSGEMHPEFMLVLSSQRVPDLGLTPYDLLAIKPLDYDHHFCDTNCLGAWVEKKKANAI
jgi:hypothetical protein